MDSKMKPNSTFPWLQRPSTLWTESTSLVLYCANSPVCVLSLIKLLCFLLMYLMLATVLLLILCTVFSLGSLCFSGYFNLILGVASQSPYSSPISEEWHALCTPVVTSWPWFACHCKYFGACLIFPASHWASREQHPW